MSDFDHGLFSKSKKYCFADDFGVITPRYKLCGLQRINVEFCKEATARVLVEEAFCYYNSFGKEEIFPGDYKLFIGTSLPDERSFELTDKSPLCMEVKI